MVHAREWAKRMQSDSPGGMWKQESKGMGTLKYSSVDLNVLNNVQSIIGATQAELNKSVNYFTLQHTLPSYFSTHGIKLTSDPGWYIILDDKTPIYVGEAQNLNVRLNTPNGSRDNFGHKARTSDSQRNFIKKFSEVQLITNLRVAVIVQPALITAAGLNAASFTDRDRKNIEKVLNIYRSKLKYI